MNHRYSLHFWNNLDLRLYHGGTLDHLLVDHYDVLEDGCEGPVLQNLLMWQDLDDQALLQWW